MAAKEKVFKIKNVYLIGLTSWLNELMLHGPQSRERTRFAKKMAERVGENEEFRKGLLTKYSDGIGETGEIKWKEGGEESANKEYKELMEEDYKVDITGATREQFDIVKELVLNTRHQFGPSELDTGQDRMDKIRQAGDYLMWCEAFEQV